MVSGYRDQHAIHEFFRVSVTEAIYCGAFPVLPRRLSYPELLPETTHERCLYGDSEDLMTKLRCWHSHSLPDLAGHAAMFDWSVQAPVYDDLLQSLAGHV